MTCKILDPGTGVATHYGNAIGRGLYLARGDDGSVTLCQHPGNDPLTPAASSITLTADEWDAAVSGMDAVPEPPKAAPEPKAHALAKRKKGKK